MILRQELELRDGGSRASRKCRLRSRRDWRPNHSRQRSCVRVSDGIRDKCIPALRKGWRGDLRAGPGDDGPARQCLVRDGSRSLRREKQGSGGSPEHTREPIRREHFCSSKE